MNADYVGKTIGQVAFAAVADVRRMQSLAWAARQLIEDHNDDDLDEPEILERVGHLIGVVETDAGSLASSLIEAPLNPTSNRSDSDANKQPDAPLRRYIPADFFSKLLEHAGQLGQGRELEGEEWDEWMRKARLLNDQFYGFSDENPDLRMHAESWTRFFEGMAKARRARSIAIYNTRLAAQGEPHRAVPS